MTKLQLKKELQKHTKEQGIEKINKWFDISKVILCGNKYVVLPWNLTTKYIYY